MGASGEYVCVCVFGVGGGYHRNKSSVNILRSQ